MDAISTLKKTQIFKEKIEDYYNKKVDEIDGVIPSQAITEYTTTQELLEIQLGVFNRLWSWQRITINKDNIIPDHDYVDFPTAIASDIIGNGFTFSFSDNQSKLLVVKFQIPFDGNENALNYTANNYKREFRGLVYNGLITLYFYSQKRLEEVAKTFVEDKDRFIKMIEDNQRDINAFMEDRAEVFKSIIKSKMDSVYQKVLQRKSGNDLLR